MLLLLAVALAALAFLVTGRVPLGVAMHAVDVDLLLVLFALLIAVEILRESGWLDDAVAKTTSRFNHTRSFTAMMIVVTGALAALVTNDVTLFIVVPFTIAAGRLTKFDVEDAVILEIVAANLLGCLTPLGNPQNLFVYHRSGWSAAQFVMTMLPFVTLSAVGLAIAVMLLPRETLSAHDVALPPRNNRAAVAGAITFALVLLEIARTVNGWPAAIAAAISAALFLRRRVDLSIVPLFFFAFIVVEGLRTFPIHARDIYWTSIAASQLISNVPATVLLTPFANGAWRTLLYGVNAGGCGTIIASLANLLGWRIYVRESGKRELFWRLTLVSFAFLVFVAVGGKWLL